MILKLETMIILYKVILIYYKYSFS